MVDQWWQDVAMVPHDHAVLLFLMFAHDMSDISHALPRTSVSHPKLPNAVMSPCG